MRNIISVLALVVGSFTANYAQTHSKESILLTTNYGNMTIKLFEETPLHTANFLKLVKEGTHDSLLFHRVINQFMIQGGDPLSRHAKPGDSLGHGDLGYMVQAEFNEKLIHKKGRLCAARDGDDVNPKMASSASQFYIVMGRKRTNEELKKYEERINKASYGRAARAYMASEQGKIYKKEYNRLKQINQPDSAALINKLIEEGVNAEYAKSPEYKFNNYQVETYTKEGGTPHLDGTYTVFGEVVEGLDVIDKIAAAKTDKRDRPLEDIRMKLTLIQSKD